MGRTRWVVGAGLILAALGSAGAAAVFPNALYVYVEPSDVIRKSHFTPLAEEVVAIERALGVQLGRIPTVHAGCTWITLPVPGDTFPSLWRAPKAGVIRGVTCETGGVNSEVHLDLQVDDGSPASLFSSFICGNGMPAMTAPAAGAMALGDRLDLAIGDVVGAAEWVSVCFEFEPGPGS